MAKMKPVLSIIWLLFSVTTQIQEDAYNVRMVTETIDGSHMFPYGPAAGDEQILVGSLPLEKTLHGRPMFGRGVPYNTIKIFVDGHVELQDEQSRPETPYIAPYHIPYSVVTSGHVWYRETQDQDSLGQMKDEIQKNYPVDGFVTDPDGMVILTWQLQNISTPSFPECEPTTQTGYPDLCSCLNNLNPSWENHYHCECKEFGFFRSESDCSFMMTMHDLRYTTCQANVHLRPGTSDWDNRCICEARNTHWHGNCSESMYCAVGFNPNCLVLEKLEVCESCNCRSAGNSESYCYCHTVGDYTELGLMKCFLLFAAKNWPCLTHNGGVYYKMLCADVTDCQKPENAGTDDCSCILPDTLTEPELMHCLLELDYRGDVWLCDEPDFDLDYCSCITDRTPGDVNDEIYCRCYVYSKGNVGGNATDLCQCLLDFGYKGKLSDCCTRMNFVGCQPEIQHTQIMDVTEYQNVFQAVLVYNEWQTFVYFIYQKLVYSHIHVSTKLGHVIDDSFMGYVHPYPVDLNFIHFLLFDSNLKKDGRWLYRVGWDIDQPDWTPSTRPLVG